MTAFSKGDWVASTTRIGRVKTANKDGSLDIVLYTRQGARSGRESPAMGGPRSFEPCCSASGWRQIVKPTFPLSRNAYINEIVTFLPETVK